MDTFPALALVRRELLSSLRRPRSFVLLVGFVLAAVLASLVSGAIGIAMSSAEMCIMTRHDLAKVMSGDNVADREGASTVVRHGGA